MNTTATNRPPYSIRFPLTKEKTNYRRGHGPRYRLTVDRTGLRGARACIAGMIASALLYRDGIAARTSNTMLQRAERLGMRHAALWARVFAGQIRDDDARLDAVSAERTRLILAIVGKTSAA